MRKKLKRKTKNRYRLARVQVPFMCLLWNKWKKKTKNRYRLAGYRGLIVEPILLQLVTLSGYGPAHSGFSYLILNSYLLILPGFPFPFFLLKNSSIHTTHLRHCVSFLATVYSFTKRQAKWCERN